MSPPRFVGVFASQFPGWTEGPVDSQGWYKGGDGLGYSSRFLPVGVSAIDEDGRCWVLVHDHAITGPFAKRLLWKVFEAPVGE